jgi:hypothetical protein
MRRGFVRALSASVVACGLLALPVAASASVTIADNYFGGANYYNDPGDVIGSSTFDTLSATFERLGSSLRVTINTNFAGAPETGNSLGTGYGALFLTPGVNAWTPTGPGPGYHTDTYQAGDWAYAVTMPFNPGLGNFTGASGLYATNTGVIGMSNVGGNYSGSNFRNNQAVEFFPGAGPVAAANWTVGAGKVTFDIHDNGLLGNDFAFSWAMTCANDVIQGQVAVPEPATWALMILGFGSVGTALRRRKALAAA